MRKRKLFFSLLPALLAAALCATAQDGGLTAKPIRYTFNLPDIEKLPQNIRPMGINNDKAGCDITYLITGSNLAELDRDSITITSITTKDGKDISKDSRGRAAWKFDGFFAKISDDGKYATFSIFVPLEGTTLMLPTVKGTLTAKTAGKTETATLTFKIADKGKEQKAGPFTFAVADTSKKNDGMMGFGPEGFGMTMKGDGSLVTEIVINAGGKKIKKNGHMSSGNQATYYFESAPTTPEFTLTVTYFADMKDVTVTLGQ